MKTEVSILTVLIIITSVITSWGASLNGFIVDHQNGEPVEGALIKLVGANSSSISNDDGHFVIEIPFGNHADIVINRLGYQLLKARIDDLGGAEVEIALHPKILKGQEVIVRADRGLKGKTPAAFSNLSNKEISEEYWAQDAPMLLSSMPNSFAYSDAGNGIGYSYLKLRGFNQNRISVMINGIPLNGAESHEVYWVDLPDFINNIQDIQVQRGVGTSLYGQSALGGSVNMITNDFSTTPSLKFESGYGSFNTKKLSISGNSGLIKDSYVFYGRFSKINTDGYRDNSWVNMYSYFFGISRYDRNMTWKFNTYGGPEELHLAYKGITQEQLNANRKYNEFEYKDEIDHFNQPHYEFFHDWNLGDMLMLSNTIYYFHGEGYYNQYRGGQDLAEHNLGAFYDFNTWAMYTDSDSTFPDYYYANLDTLGNPVADTSGDYQGYYALSTTTTDLIRKPVVKEYDWGWIPRITFEHDRGKFIFGGEMRIHASHHYGEILWAQYYPNGYSPNRRYHDYRGKSRTFTVYANETFLPIDRLTLMANVQYQRHSYELEDDGRYNVTFEKDYDFFSPRAGLIYNILPDMNVFISTSIASRQPAFQDIYNPQDYWSNPEYRSVSFVKRGNLFEYVGKELKPERLFDLEFGVDFSAQSTDFEFHSEINLYRMQINDELVPYAGQIDDMNLPIAGNADKTLHQGIEFEFKSYYQNKFTFSGNVSVNDDHFVNYVEYDWNGNRIDLSGNRIGGFPEIMANYHLSWNYSKFSIGLGGRYVGEQNIDNSEGAKLDAYNVLNSDFSVDLGNYTGLESLRFTVRIMNVLDEEYEQSGYADWNDGLPRYIVGAERNFFISLSTEL
ncbi:MAG: TonB-dependent receptor [candidate division Zixibacteria bacterium]|nr:TonB-dependent receptor [candidate division Zixibacteria bacterium]